MTRPRASWLRYLVSSTVALLSAGQGTPEQPWVTRVRDGRGSRLAPTICGRYYLADERAYGGSELRAEPRPFALSDLGPCFGCAYVTSELVPDALALRRADGRGSKGLPRGHAVADTGSSVLTTPDTVAVGAAVFQSSRASSRAGRRGSCHRDPVRMLRFSPILCAGPQFGPVA